ncbi:MAG: 2Fe-2S iron-sulfur cluster binding domain-containing protein [Deltaproteobacteria bacterium]|nr:2Fe-2S iron-sulfur cluster binding domain-containing protein [Deltaproteobacteria bacterium]
MPTILFKPLGIAVSVDANTKILVAANRNKVTMRYGCASCRCGTCGVSVQGGSLTPMRTNELSLLAKMKLTTDGSIRLACQARVLGGDLEVDLAFQDTYSPDAADDADTDGFEDT